MQRRNYFIKKGFQVQFIYKFIVLLLLESVLIGGLFFLVSRDTLTTGYLDSGLRIEPTQNFFLVPFLLITLIVVVGVSLAGMVVFVVLSHRIAGPLYRFEKVLEQLTGGDLTTTVHLRKTDQLAVFEKRLNVFIETLGGRIRELKAKVKEAKEALSEAGDPHLVAKINQKLDSLQDEIDRFRIPTDFKNRQ